MKSVKLSEIDPSRAGRAARKDAEVSLSTAAPRAPVLRSWFPDARWSFVMWERSDASMCSRPLIGCSAATSTGQGGRAGEMAGGWAWGVGQWGSERIDGKYYFFFFFLRWVVGIKQSQCRLENITNWYPIRHNAPLLQASVLKNLN